MAPVCALHTAELDAFREVMGYSSGDLKFASYRYYKAFCELNHIARTTTKPRAYV